MARNISPSSMVFDVLWSLYSLADNLCKHMSESLRAMHTFRCGLNWILNKDSKVLTEISCIEWLRSRDLE